LPGDVKPPTPIAPPQPWCFPANLPFSNVQELATRDPASRNINAPSSEPDDKRPSLIVKPDKDKRAATLMMVPLGCLLAPATLKTRPLLLAEMDSTPVAARKLTSTPAAMSTTDERMISLVILIEAPVTIAALSSTSVATSEYSGMVVVVVVL